MQYSINYNDIIQGLGHAVLAELGVRAPCSWLQVRHTLALKGFRVEGCELGNRQLCRFRVSGTCCGEVIVHPQRLGARVYHVTAAT